MAIKYVPQGLKNEIEVEGYGKFFVRKRGAGEELQVRADMRELDEIRADSERLTKKYKDKGADAKLSKEDLETLKRHNQRITELSDELYSIQKASVTAANPAMVDKLFNELEMPEINKIINRAILGEGTEEANDGVVES